MYEQAAAASEWSWFSIGIICFFIFIVIMLLWLTFYPRYNVWAAHKEGEADLAQAKNEQQIQIAQAQSRLDAAQINKKAAIIEAEAVAAQIQTIGENLQRHDLYLKWQWIKMMEERSSGDTIYVPTEANLPILEAGKRSLNSAIPDKTPTTPEK